ncbi:hypothetical protein HPB52_001765 [Rhipicephalus sanguineus]|uniref:SH3 domain-containing protein n=1 Tax=Rhipicephalus sanguineus TaxID=34632 RepID=A0A9D4SPX3_RHISA|nr:hypothetical protein HPB52_001765 [Rhipicephalus sanguineus]
MRSGWLRPTLALASYGRPRVEKLKRPCGGSADTNSVPRFPYFFHPAAVCLRASPRHRSPLSASSPSSTTTSGGGLLQLQDATHRGLYRFVPRHADEVAIDIGDPVYVSKEADDAWCEGVNLRTGATGIFPSAYVIDVDYSDFGSEGQQIRKERYLLDFLGSVEVSCHKGSEVFCQAIRKVAKASASEVGVHGSHPCVLEVTDLGLRMVDRGRPAPNHVPTHDYFFNLKNVTFCGYHPKDHKYFGFITKHPLRERFACHVFQAEGSTREVAEAVG